MAMTYFGIGRFIVNSDLLNLSPFAGSDPKDAPYHYLSDEEHDLSVQRLNTYAQHPQQE